MSQTELSPNVEAITQELCQVDEDIKRLKNRRKFLEQQLTALKKEKASSIEKQIARDFSATNEDADIIPVNTNSLEFWETKTFPWDENVRTCLHQSFKLNSFRPSQRAAINAVMSRRDCILIMPTGAGKSLCYQLPACLLDGITIVISPLVSLTEDQQISSTSFGIGASVLNSHTKVPMQTQIMHGMRDGNSNLKIVYITPEKFAKSEKYSARYARS